MRNATIFLGLALLCSLLTSNLSAKEGAGELKKVKARTIELSIPAHWKSVPTTSRMRAAQFSISGKDKAGCDLVVFYFGGPTGGIKANVGRWVGQFDAADRKITMTQGKCAAGKFIIVDAVGTWDKPDGPPFAQKKVKTPGSRVVNVILIEDRGDQPEDYYFLKLSGSKDAVGSEFEALKTAIGADSKSEKPFDLKDAAN